MSGIEITNHLNAAIVACEVAKSKLLPMVQRLYPDHPENESELVKDDWFTSLWAANNYLLDATGAVKSAIGGIKGDKRYERTA